MKTSHQLARELLAGPDLPIFHFDPSCAGFNSDNDTSVSEPKFEQENSFEYEDEDGVAATSGPYLMIVGSQHSDHGLKEGT